MPHCRRIRVLVATLPCLLGGCAATVPLERPSSDAAAKRFIPASGEAEVFVVRAGDRGSAFLVSVVLDGRNVGSLAPATFLRVPVAPGEHVVSVVNSANAELSSIRAAAGKSYFVGVSTDVLFLGEAPDAHLREVSEQEGRGAVLSSRLAIASIPLQ